MDFLNMNGRKVKIIPACFYLLHIDLNKIMGNKLNWSNSLNDNKLHCL